jgi:hypothetical protein
VSESGGANLENDTEREEKARRGSAKISGRRERGSELEQSDSKS